MRDARLLPPGQLGPSVIGPALLTCPHGRGGPLPEHRGARNKLMGVCRVVLPAGRRARYAVNTKVKFFLLLDDALVKDEELRMVPAIPLPVPLATCTTVPGACACRAPQRSMHKAITGGDAGAACCPAPGPCC